MQAPPERLGSFYLGAEYDLTTATRSETAVHYDARDLTTHAVCVGMTGSGKTGLCIGLLEEAALDKVPALLIDPKGDITNLLLQFPQLRPQDFQPWVNPDDARRKGQSVEEYAAATATQWRNGLADWGIQSARIRLLQETTDFTIFTPGSDAGIPISILSSLAAPDLDFDHHAEALRERIAGTVSALLGLVGINADPVRSRESILLSTLFEHYWRQRQDLDLATLITAIQNPPLRQLGVFDIDTFYPQKERFTLAMAFNSLVASPSFQSWLQGEPLAIDQLFYTAEGKPRHSIFYIAHLSDSARMFFVTLLLESLLTWVRSQSGTTSLRALLYFDEIFGYFPPVAEPPSKRPLLTLLKQARAFGLGVILVTQNPVDIDYKGLTNAGTWFIGKLQTDRDKDRVLAGLKGAIAESGGNADVDYNTLISRLGSRVFLMHNVHEGAPLVFHTRWAMSYLRGPLTRPQVRTLMADRRGSAASPAQVRVSERPPVPASAIEPTLPGFTNPSAGAPLGFGSVPPALDPAVPMVFLPITVAEQEAVRQLAQERRHPLTPQSVQLIYEPALLGAANVRYVDRKRKLDEQVEKVLLVPAPEGLRTTDWSSAERMTLRLRDLANRPVTPRTGQDSIWGPHFAPTPEGANSASELRAITKEFSDWLYYNSRLAIKVHPELELFQHPDEREREFQIRLQQAARERRDAEVDALKRKTAATVAKLEERLRRQERDLVANEAHYAGRKQEELIGLGETVLAFLLGRRSTRAFSQVATKRRMTSGAKSGIERSRQQIAELRSQIEALEAELRLESDEITRKWADLLDDLTDHEISPRRTDVNVQLVALAWLPSWLLRYDGGGMVQTATVAAYPLPDPGS